jgi:hypothetical protein
MKGTNWVDKSNPPASILHQQIITSSCHSLLPNNWCGGLEGWWGKWCNIMQYFSQQDVVLDSVHSLLPTAVSGAAREIG